MLKSDSKEKKVVSREQTVGTVEQKTDVKSKPARRNLRERANVRQVWRGSFRAVYLKVSPKVSFAALSLLLFRAQCNSARRNRQLLPHFVCTQRSLVKGKKESRNEDKGRERSNGD